MYLACWFTLTLFRSGLLVKVVGQSLVADGEKFERGNNCQFCMHIARWDKGMVS